MTDGQRRSFRHAVAAFSIAALVSCNPATTRPAFMPLPQADTLVLRGPPGKVAAEAASWLTAQGLGVERWSERDAYVETTWYDTTSKQARRGEGDLNRVLTSVKIRCWADPGPPGQTRITVEAVYRPFYDPSQPPRLREVSLPDSSGGQAIVKRMFADLSKRLGVRRDSVVTPPRSEPIRP
jgi:hypothetical protein